MERWKPVTLPFCSHSENTEDKQMNGQSVAVGAVALRPVETNTSHANCELPLTAPGAVWCLIVPSHTQDRRGLPSSAPSVLLATMCNQQVGLCLIMNGSTGEQFLL